MVLVTMYGLHYWV